MSTAMSLWCLECRANIWLGQQGLAGHFIYAIDEDEHIILQDFFIRHEGHPLMYSSLSVFEMVLEDQRQNK